MSRLPVEARPAARRDADRLLRAGVSSFEDLARVARSEAEKPELRIMACWLLGRLRRGQRVEPLLAALRSTVATVRRQAAEALGLVGGKRAETALMVALRRDPDTEVRELSAFALRLVGTRGSVGSLVEALKDKKEAVAVRSAAAEALGDIHDRRAVSPLIEMLGDPAAAVRYWGATALGTLRARSAIPPLERLSKDRAEVPDWGTVGEAAQSAIERIRKRTSR